MTNMGRKMSQMKMKQGTDARQATLSQRPSGLCKKVRELCTLCAFKAALVIFSPGGKAFTFGHPDAWTSMNKVPPTWKPNTFSSQLTQSEHKATVNAPNKVYHYLLQQLETEKKHGEQLEQMRLEGQRQGKDWIDIPLDELSLMELLALYAYVEKFQAKLRKRMEELSAQAAAPGLSSAANSAKVIDPSPTEPTVDSNCHGNGTGTGPGK